MSLVSAGVLGERDGSLHGPRVLTAQRRLKLLPRFWCDSGVKGLCSCPQCVGRLYLEVCIERRSIVWKRPNPCKIPGLTGEKWFSLRISVSDVWIGFWIHELWRRVTVCCGGNLHTWRCIGRLIYNVHFACVFWIFKVSWVFKVSYYFPVIIYGNIIYFYKEKTKTPLIIYPWHSSGL